MLQVKAEQANMCVVVNNIHKTTYINLTPDRILENVMFFNGNIYGKNIGVFNFVHDFVLNQHQKKSIKRRASIVCRWHTWIYKY